MMACTTNTREKIISMLIWGVPGLSLPVVATWNIPVSTAPISDVTEHSVNGAGKRIIVAAYITWEEDFFATVRTYRAL